MDCKMEKHGNQIEFTKIEQGLKGTLLYGTRHRSDGGVVTFDVMFDHISLPAPSEVFEQAKAFARQVARPNKTVHVHRNDLGQFVIA